MFELLEKVRQKPERTKKRIAFLIAFFIAGMIFVVWLSIIYPEFRRNQVKEDEASKLEPSPLETFKESFKSGASELGEQFNNIKESVASFATSTLYVASSTSQSTSTSPIFEPSSTTTSTSTVSF